MSRVLYPLFEGDFNLLRIELCSFIKRPLHSHSLSHFPTVAYVNVADARADLKDQTYGEADPAAIGRGEADPAAIGRGGKIKNEILRPVAGLYKDVDTLVEAGVVYNKEASPGVEMPPPRLK